MSKTTKEVPNTKTKAGKQSDSMKSLRTKLKSADSEIRYYVTALEKENLKFQKKIGQLQVDNTSLQNRIIITENHLKECCVHDSIPYKCLQEAEVKISAELKKLKKLKQNS